MAEDTINAEDYSENVKVDVPLRKREALLEKGCQHFEESEGKYMTPGDLLKSDTNACGINWCANCIYMRQGLSRTFYENVRH